MAAGTAVLVAPGVDAPPAGAPGVGMLAAGGWWVGPSGAV